MAHIRGCLLKVCQKDCLQNKEGVDLHKTLVIS